MLPLPGTLLLHVSAGHAPAGFLFEFSSRRQFRVLPPTHYSTGPAQKAAQADEFRRWVSYTRSKVG